MKLLKPFEVDLSGVNLVEASAGTGKTYNITSLYIRTLIERDISVNKILVVTYTEAATKELKDRLLERIHESISVLRKGEVGDASDQFLNELLAEVSNPKKALAKLEKAVRTFDEASIYTIHGFCYQALQEQAFESRAMYDAEMIGDDSDLVQEAVDDYWRKWVAEVSDDPEKQVLQKLLNENNGDPESLARQLGGYAGKPYLKVLPENTNRATIEKELSRLWDLYADIQSTWSEQRDELFCVLNSGELSYYTTNSLNKWFELMDEFLHSDVPRLNTFTQFYRFKQSEIDESLKKKPKRQGKQPPQHIFFQLIDQYAEVVETVKKFETVFKKDLLNYLQDELQNKKEELQVLSYDDLLLRLRNALLDEQRGDKLADKLREKYPVAMVDEFQDTDPNQYDIFRSIYADSDRCALFMIGDPKQSIYGFRGADVYSYIKARKDVPEENRYRLDRNFRSTPDLLRGLNTFWGNHPNPFAADQDINYQKVEWGWPEEEYAVLRENGRKGPPIRFRRLSKLGQDKMKKEDACEKVARDTAEEIERLIEGGKKKTITIGNDPLRAKDIAVLVRRHDQAELVSEALRDRDIKSVRHSEQSVFESEEAEQMEQLLKAVAEPANETLIKTALSLPLTGYTAKELFSIEENEDRWIKVLQQFADWHRKWQNQGFAAMFRSLLTEMEVAEHVIRYPDGERRLTNLLHLGELLQEESRNHKEGTRGLLNWLTRKRQDTGGEGRDEEQMRLESDEALVKIVTMHKSKGLQYPVVFCPFLWHGPRIYNSGQPLEYHHPDDTETAYLDLSGKSVSAEKRFYHQKEELAESLRLAYVAMTRAQHSLYLTWQFANASQFSSLGYLLQDPQKAIALLKAKVGYGDSVKWSGDEMHNRIEKLCTQYPDLFTMTPEESDFSENGQLELEMNEGPPKFRARSFQRTTPLETGYGVSSFSSLSRSMQEENPDVPDYDQFLDYADEKLAEQEEDRSIFTFPKGPDPGTCIHKIFEEIDFQKPNAELDLVSQQLTKFGIDCEWQPVVGEMLQTVTGVKIHPENKEITLQNIPAGNMIQELEFYYKNEKIRTERLLSIIRNGETTLPISRGGAESGFLKGFIDLTFEFDGQYYLLDYKTNYLGDSFADYRLEILREEMREASYDLQYHIYTLALHRFLKKNLQDYSYEQDFGGAFYLFLRGMNGDGREGIFFDCPDYSVIKELDEYIKSGGQDE